MFDLSFIAIHVYNTESCYDTVPYKKILWLERVHTCKRHWLTHIYILAYLLKDQLSTELGSFFFSNISYVGYENSNIDVRSLVSTDYYQKRNNFSR